MKIDLSNKVFGVYKVLEYDLQMSAEKRRGYWKCKCQQCNNIQSVRVDGLKRNPKSCPLCKYPNLVGQVFGNLTVLSKGQTDKNGHASWLCKCNCGTIKEISGTNLIQGYTQSCGCLQKDTVSKKLLKDLKGQRFGKLTVIERDDQNNQPRVHWLCKCDCGNTVSVQGNNLLNSHTQSCGCIHSKGELKIREILLTNQILFKTEYSFSDLPKRRFDFAIFNDNGQLSHLIEFDGLQHFQFVNTWHKTKETYNEAYQRDLEKNIWCKEQSIPLIRIPYTRLENLNLEDLMLNTTNFLI